MKSLPLIALSSVLVFASASARAECSMAVESDAAVRAHFPRLGDEIRSAFLGRSDIDACARIAIRSTRGKIQLDVELPDGRNASRVVTRSDDVVPTLAALLVVPPAPAPEPEPEPEPAPEPVVTPAPADVPPPMDRPVVSPTEPPSQLGFELAALVGTRVGDGHYSAGIGVQSFLEHAGWLVGFGVRLDQYQPIGELSVTPALQGALLLGRRYRAGSTAFDIIGGAAIVSLGGGDARAQVATPKGVVEEHQVVDRTMLPRALAATRVNFAMRSIVRPFLALEGELGPHQSDDVTIAETPRFPIWTLGLALGGTLGTR